MSPRTSVNSVEAALAKVREICLTMPDSRETLTWGKPHFRVGDKIFAGFDDAAAKPVLGFKLSMARQAEMLRDGRFTKMAYVGHKGWVSMVLVDVRDWEEVRSLVLESYRAIAAKKSLAKLGELPRAPVRPKPARSRRAR